MDERLVQLKQLIDEENFPYFTDEFLTGKLSQADIDLRPLARELCIIKSGIPEIQLGDIIIPSPREHFMILSQTYRGNGSRVVVRADEK